MRNHANRLNDLRTLELVLVIGAIVCITLVSLVASSLFAGPDDMPLTKEQRCEFLKNFGTGNGGQMPEECNN